VLPGAIVGAFCRSAAWFCRRLDDNDHVENPARLEKVAMQRHIVGERARLQALVDSITASFDDLTAAADASPPDDEHDPEGHTIAFERSQLAARRDSFIAAIQELDQAEERVVAGLPSLCEECAQPIPNERLLALPATTRCIRCAGETDRSRRITTRRR
jgi:DnaK suppressor protein